MWRGRAEVVAPPAPSEAPTAAAPPTPFESEVATVVARKLNVPRASIDITHPLSRYGIDSLGAVELAEELERTFGAALPMQTLSPVEAGAIPETFFTVWHKVFQRGALKSGETMLVKGGSSGIGKNAIQIAKNLGARVLVKEG